MRNEILGAIARGWCSPENSGKEVDATLAEAIADEVMKFIDAKFTSHNSDYAAALYKLLDELYYDGEKTDAKIVAGVEAIQRLNASHFA